jgi:hypothetical protein
MQSQIKLLSKIDISNEVIKKRIAPAICSEFLRLLEMKDSTYLSLVHTGNTMRGSI